MGNAEPHGFSLQSGYGGELERMCKAGVRPATTTSRERAMRGTLGLIVIIILVVIALKFFGVI